MKHNHTNSIKLFQEFLSKILNYHNILINVLILNEDSNNNIKLEKEALEFLNVVFMIINSKLIYDIVLYNLELQLLTLLNKDISELLKLPASDMRNRNLVMKLFYNDNLNQLEQDQLEFVNMTKAYFNNLDNFYLALLDNPIIQDKYKINLDQIAIKYENKEANGNKSAFTKRKAEQVSWLKNNVIISEGI